MRRVPEVMDCWFDSGAMPFAQRGHPRQGKELFEETFPAEFITEALDQTRGWFYSLLAISTLLFHQNAYRNVICLGLVVDPKGQKHSKSRGNVLDPNYLFDTFGSDAVRWYFYTAAPVGENYRTSADTLKETVQQFLLPLWNCYAFHVNYAVVDHFNPDRVAVPLKERPVLDRWLLSRLAGLVKTVDSELADYDVTGASRPIHAFVDELSRWYIRRSRNRFWKAQSDEDKLAAAHRVAFARALHAFRRRRHAPQPDWGAQRPPRGLPERGRVGVRSWARGADGRSAANRRGG
jgi:isoleucyl-tRNA synthetase